MQAEKMSFLRRVSGLSLKNRVRNQSWQSYYTSQMTSVVDGWMNGLARLLKLINFYNVTVNPNAEST